MLIKVLRFGKYLVVDIYYLFIFSLNRKKYIYKKYDRVVILGAGRSLIEFDLKLQSTDLVILLNGVGEDFRISEGIDKIWLIEDKKAWINYRETVLKRNILTVIPQDIFINRSNIQAVSFMRSSEFLSNWYYSDRINFWGGTVAYLALQIALRSMAKSVHLAGIDMYNTAHYKDEYYCEDKQWNTPVVERMYDSMCFLLKKALKQGIVVTSESDTFDHLGVNK